MGLNKTLLNGGLDFIGIWGIVRICGMVLILANILDLKETFLEGGFLEMLWCGFESENVPKIIKITYNNYNEETRNVKGMKHYYI